MWAASITTPPTLGYGRAAAKARRCAKVEFPCRGARGNSTFLSRGVVNGGSETELQKAALIRQVGHGVQDESVGRGEAAELVDPAFAATEDREHRQVDLGGGASSANRFDDQNASGRGNGLDATLQDLVRALVVPVVQDVAQQVGPRTLGERVEEAPRGHLGPAVEPVRTEDLASLGRGGFEVDEVAADPGMGGEDRGEKGAMTAADVDDGGEAGPVVAGDDLRDLLAEPVCHPLIERLAQVRMFGEIGPKTPPVAAVVPMGVRSTIRSAARWPSSNSSATADTSCSVASWSTAPSPRSRSGSPRVTATRNAIGVASPARSRIAATPCSVTKVNGGTPISPPSHRPAHPGQDRRRAQEVCRDKQKTGQCAL